MANYQTYQTDYGFITIDADIEVPPYDYIAGPFNIDPLEHIEVVKGAEIDINDAGTDVVITPVEAA